MLSDTIMRLKTVYATRLLLTDTSVAEWEMQHATKLHYTEVITGAARVGPETRPAAAIVNSPVCAHTGLPLTSA